MVTAEGIDPPPPPHDQPDRKKAVVLILPLGFIMRKMVRK